MQEIAMSSFRQPGRRSSIVAGIVAILLLQGTQASASGPFPGNSQYIGSYAASGTQNALTQTVQFDLGRFVGGTTIRVGTWSADGDLPYANAAGDTFLRLFDGAQEIANNDDAGQDAFVRASYIVFTLAKDTTFTLRAGCYSSLSCSGNIYLKSDLDSNGAIGNVQSSFDSIAGGSGVKLNVCPGPLRYPHYSVSHSPHFQSIQRIRSSTLVSAFFNSNQIALTASNYGELSTILTKNNHWGDTGPLAPSVNTPCGNGTGLGVVGLSPYGSSHLGGAQASGHYLAGGFDMDGGTGKVIILDRDDPASTSGPINSFLLPEGSGTTGFTKRPGANSPFLLVVGGASAQKVYVLTCPSNHWGYSDPYTCSLGFSSSVRATLDLSSGWPVGTEGFQALNLVNQSNGVLYMIGARGEGTGNPEGGTDKAWLYRLDPDGAGPFMYSKQLNGRVYTCTIGGTRQCGFNATFGVFLNLTGDSLIVYSSKAYVPDSSSDPITIMEFK